MMTNHKVDNIFSTEELNTIKQAVLTYDYEVDHILGRKRIGDIKNSFSKDIVYTLYEIAKQYTDLPLSMDHALYVEYSPKYGKPNLLPHFDGDTNDLIINMQLDSNTTWDLGLNLETYTLEDNSALVFNGNKEIHWRVHKEFKENEFVSMIFIRFYNSEKRSDYSYLPNHPDDEIFKEVRAFRDSLI